MQLCMACRAGSEESEGRGPQVWSTSNQHKQNKDMLNSLEKELDESFKYACPDNAECLKFQLETQD